MSRYAESYKRSNLKGPGDARPTALQIVKDEGLENKLSDKVYLITGVSSGIGIETLRAIHATGAHAYGTVRNVAKGQKVVDEILASNPNGGKIDLIEIDNTDLSSVRKGAADFLQKSGGKLNVLINNAGIMAVPEGKTKDGFEMQFGTNHLAHFLLFQLVKDALLSTATAEFPSRVISVSSTGHRVSPVLFDDINFEKQPYNHWLAYGQSKTANAWFANALNRKYSGQNLIAFANQPGLINTGLGWALSEEELKMFGSEVWQKYQKTPEQGAATQIWLALAEESKSAGGKWISDCQVQQKHGVDPSIPQEIDDGYADWIFDEASQERLWKESFGMVGLKEE
jgi:NAD(P)-dependent dehydrogenase (short-subunit alcohol dehydrogenase family)